MSRAGTAHAAVKTLRDRYAGKERNTKMRKRRKIRELKPGSVFYACLVYLFLYLPIFVVIAFSFNTSEMNITFQGFTIEWYGRMFENRQLMQSFFNTVIVAERFARWDCISLSLS